MALDERTRKWVDSASSRPPPSAMEEMADMVGTGRLASDANVPRRLLRNSSVLNVMDDTLALAHPIDQQKC
jgi:hypothetical protein